MLVEQLHAFQMISGMKLKIFLPDEKPENTIGRPIIPFRKVFDGIMFILRTGSQWKMLPKEYVLVPHVTEDFKNGENQIYLINYGQDCYKYTI